MAASRSLGTEVAARRSVDIDELSANHGGKRVEALDLALRDAQVIGRENDEVGELAWLDRPLEIFFEGDARVVHGVGAQRLFAGDALGGAIDAVGDRVA